MTLLALVSPKEVQPIHVGESSSPRPLLRLVTLDYYLGPQVLPNAVGVEIIESLIIVGPCKQVDLAISKYALMAGPWREYLPLGQYFDPLAYFHIPKVVRGKGNILSVLVLGYPERLMPSQVIPK